VDTSTLLPSGFAASTNTTSVTFYSPDGVVTGILPTSDLGYIGPQTFHVAGGTSGGIPPVIYFTWQDTARIIQNNAGVETLLVEEIDFNRMSGAIGSPWFAYTTVSYADSGLLTRLYIGTAETIAAATPSVEIISDDFQGLKPLALRMEGGTPTGVWYTGCMYGIGGDLVYDPCNRLTFLDIGTGINTELLGDGYNPSQLSPDHAWVAYAPPGGGMPLTIRNLQTGWNYTFPIWPENDRGSGDGVFSPDNHYVAWMEAAGYRMDEPPTFRSLLRIATTEGTLVGEFPTKFFAATVGFDVNWTGPVAWLDNDSLLVQVGSVDGTDDAVVRLDLPSSLVFLTTGYFTALTYP
jgi:hypothetical protein